jgi:hypothetical protein
LSRAAATVICVFGLVALVLLYLPSSSSDFPTVLVKAMLLVLAGLVVAVVRGGVNTNGTRNRPNIRVFVLLGIEVLLIAAWLMWLLDVRGLREYFPAGRSLL